MNKVKILFIQRQFSHYRKAIFERLAVDYDLLLLHTGVDNTIKESDAEYAEKVKYIKYGSKATNVFILGFNRILKFKPQIIIHEANPSILSLFFVYLLSRMIGSSFVLWGHGYNREKGFKPNKSIKDFLRLRFMKLSDAVIFYDNKTKSFFSNYLKSTKLFVAVNTIDTERLLNIKSKFEVIGREKIKKELGFDSYFNLLFIGRLLSDKLPFGLVEIFERLIKFLSQYSIHLHIIGSGPEENVLIDYLQRNGLKNKITMYGALYDEIKIGKMMFSSDLLINPGYVGLSVNHAFCFNLPVITYEQGSRGPFHSPEVEYIINGETGFFAKNYDKENFVKITKEYLTNQELQKKIRSNIAQFTKNKISINNMLDGFSNCFDYVLNYEK